jgi:hypothetical protein
VLSATDTAHEFTKRVEYWYRDAHYSQLPTAEAARRDPKVATIWPELQRDDFVTTDAGGGKTAKQRYGVDFIWSSKAQAFWKEHAHAQTFAGQLLEKEGAALEEVRRNPITHGIVDVISNIATGGLISQVAGPLKESLASALPNVDTGSITKPLEQTAQKIASGAGGKLPSVALPKPPSSSQPRSTAAPPAQDVITPATSPAVQRLAVAAPQPLTFWRWVGSLLGAHHS